MSRISKKAARELVLSNKRLKIEFIPERKNKKYTAIDPNHVAASIFKDAHRTWELRLDPKGGGYVKILTPEEQEAFEVLMDKAEGTLSFFNIGKPNNFWNTMPATVSIDKDGYVFDMNNPIDNIKCRVLCVQEDVCEDWEKRLSNGKYKWALKEEGYVSQVNAKYAKMKMTAYKELGKLSMDRQRNILISMGIKIPSKSSEELIINKFEEILNNKVTTTALPSIKDFMEALKDTDVDDKAFVEECISKGIFKYQKVGKYSFDDEKIIKSGGKAALIKYLNDADNAEFKKVVQNRLKTLTND